MTAAGKSQTAHELEEIIPRSRVLELHREFDRVKEHAYRRRLMFLRMHVNRVAQSAGIVLSTPSIWKRALRGFTNAALGRKGILRSLEIAVTYRCNSSCAQCSCRTFHDPKRESTDLLSLDEIKDVIDQAADMGAFQFGINGGEPLLEKEKVLELSAYIKRRHGAYVHLCTNGSLLTAKLARELKEAGLDSVEMGFDSIFERTHDSNRLEGSYRKILENISLCRRTGFRVTLNTILTNEKVQSDDILYTYHFAERMGCLLQITPCCLTGALKNRLDMMLTDEAKLYFHWLLSKSVNNRSDLYSSLTSIKCPAAREKIGLQPYGDVVSCPLIQIPYGNIREKPLRSIQAEMLKNPYYDLSRTEGCLPSMCKDFILQHLVDNPPAGGEKAKH